MVVCLSLLVVVVRYVFVVVCWMLCVDVFMFV